MNGMGDPSVLAFLAGAGLPGLLDQITKLIGYGRQQRNPYAPSAQLPHRSGLRLSASPNEGATIAPSMLQALMQQAQAGGGADQMQQGAPPDQQAMLQMLAQRGAA